jgi:hypothetical protein
MPVNPDPTGKGGAAAPASAASATSIPASAKPGQLGRFQQLKETINELQQLLTSVVDEIDAAMNPPASKSAPAKKKVVAPAKKKIPLKSKAAKKNKRR